VGSVWYWVNEGRRRAWRGRLCVGLGGSRGSWLRVGACGGNLPTVRRSCVLYLKRGGDEGGVAIVWGACWQRLAHGRLGPRRCVVWEVGWERHRTEVLVEVGWLPTRGLWTGPPYGGLVGSGGVGGGGGLGGEGGLGCAGPWTSAAHSYLSQVAVGLDSRSVGVFGGWPRVFFFKRSGRSPGELAIGGDDRRFEAGRHGAVGVGVGASRAGRCDSTLGSGVLGGVAMVMCGGCWSLGGLRGCRRSVGELDWMRRGSQAGGWWYGSRAPTRVVVARGGVRAGPRWAARAGVAR